MSVPLGDVTEKTQRGSHLWSQPSIVALYPLQAISRIRDAKTSEDAEIRYHAIRAWWTSSRATTTDGLQQLDL